MKIKEKGTLTKTSPDLKCKPMDFGGIKTSKRRIIKSKTVWEPEVSELMEFLLEHIGYGKTFDEFLAEHAFTKVMVCGKEKYFDWDSLLNDPVKAFLITIYTPYDWMWVSIMNRVLVQGELDVQKIITSRLITKMGEVEMPAFSIGLGVAIPKIEELIPNVEFQTWLSTHMMISENIYTSLVEKSKIQWEIIRLVTQLNQMSSEVDSDKFIENLKEALEVVAKQPAVKKISLEGFTIKVDLGWRYISDTDGNYSSLPCPPISFKYNIRTGEFRANKGVHPHVLSGGQLCLWGWLANMLDIAIKSRKTVDILLLLIQNFMQYTSSDCWDAGSRDPLEILRANTDAIGKNYPLDKDELISLCDLMGCRSTCLRKLWLPDDYKSKKIEFAL